MSDLNGEDEALRARLARLCQSPVDPSSVEGKLEREVERLLGQSSLRRFRPWFVGAAVLVTVVAILTAWVLIR